MRYQKWRHYVTKEHPYVLEIDNETRKYVLASKSHFDLEEWYSAIRSKIDTLKSNDVIAKISENIIAKEKEIAQKDQQQILSVTKLYIINSPQFQPHLIEFIGDPIISELLPNLSRYMQLVEKKEYFQHAIQKASEILRQLQEYQAKSRASKQLSSSSNEKTEVNSAIKRYKELPLDEKIDCFIA